MQTVWRSSPLRCSPGRHAVGSESSERELLGLRWEDVDRILGNFGVRQALQPADSKLRIVEPKTTTSRRTVVLPMLAVQHLRSTASGRTPSA